MKSGFKLGLIQVQGHNSLPERSERLEGMIRDAAKAGAQVVVLPELFLHDYFCIEEDQRHFDLAMNLESPQMLKWQALARETSVAIVAPFFEKRDRGLYHNSVVVFDADGADLGMYRKMHIPDDPGFYEKYYFTPGDLGFKVFPTRFGRIGVLICWDQWFPEGARLTALQGCDILLYPTAIGWDTREYGGLPESEGLKLREKQLDAWITMHRGHAIANGVYVAAVNRVGDEGHLQFWGNSVICDPGGEVLDRLDHHEEKALLVDIRVEEIENARRTWPFLRDRRIESYGNLSKRYLA